MGISLMTLKRKEQGFTIVELLIVIVVIGILAALVITTFTGIQQRARDTERTTDINAIRGHLEAYYADNGFYPQNSDLTTANLPGLDSEALTAPGGTAAPAQSATTTTQYMYNATTDGTTACTASNSTCQQYVLEADLEESGAANYQKTNL
jgi:type II secretion system protein G